MKMILVAAALFALALGGGCKSKTPPPAAKAQCGSDSDCGEGKSCRDGQCVVAAAAEAAPQSVCDRAMANVKRLNEGQGQAAIDIDLAQLRESCAGWPDTLVTCLDTAKDLAAMRICTRAIMKFEVDRVKAAKAAKMGSPEVPDVKPGPADVKPPEAKPLEVKPTDEKPADANPAVVAPPP